MNKQRITMLVGATLLAALFWGVMSAAGVVPAPGAVITILSGHQRYEPPAGPKYGVWTEGWNDSTYELYDRLVRESLDAKGFDGDDPGSIPDEEIEWSRIGVLFYISSAIERGEW